MGSAVGIDFGVILGKGSSLAKTNTHRMKQDHYEAGIRCLWGDRHLHTRTVLFTQPSKPSGPDRSRHPTKMRLGWSHPVGISFLGDYIIDVHEGSQAEKLGVQPGWTIKRINGNVISDKDIRHFAARAASNKTWHSDGNHFFAITFDTTGKGSGKNQSETKPKYHYDENGENETTLSRLPRRDDAPESNSPQATKKFEVLESQKPLPPLPPNEHSERFHNRVANVEKLRNVFVNPNPKRKWLTKENSAAIIENLKTQMKAAQRSDKNVPNPSEHKLPNSTARRLVTNDSNSLHVPIMAVVAGLLLLKGFLARRFWLRAKPTQCHHCHADDADEELN